MQEAAARWKWEHSKLEAEARKYADGEVNGARGTEAAVLSLIALARGRRGPGLLRRAHLRAREITPRIFDA